MLSWDDQGSESIVFDDGYGDDGVHEVVSSQQIHANVVLHRASLKFGSPH